MEKKTNLVDDHLLSLQGMQETGTDDFFYTRLKARMESHREEKQGWAFPLKPVWAVGTLALLLAVNTFMLTRASRPKQTTASENTSPLQSFAASYDQTISSY